MEIEYINIGKIDINKYSKLCEKKITTDEVIITNKQIEHINEERKGTYKKYENRLKEIITNPDYIIEDTKHEETGLVIKKYSKNIIVVLKLNTSNDERKNSIITIWEIKEKRLERYLLTHKIIYKKE
ncbi:MAG: PBECR2 nuclease fold domain-containing protein [Clostridia bacterium]